MPLTNDYKGWAARAADMEGSAAINSELAMRVPQTMPVLPPPLPPTMSAVLRRIADALELMEAGKQTAEEATDMLEELPPDLKPLMQTLLGMPTVVESEEEEGTDGDE